MNSFEVVVGEILKAKGYWVWPNFKVNLTKEQKKAIGRPTSPRWEIDLLAYKGRTHELIVAECKSYLDSAGVRYKDLANIACTGGRYKLFTDSRLRTVVFEQLTNQLFENGTCPAKPKIVLCLAAGKIANDRDREMLHDFFVKEGWYLWDETWIKNALDAISQSGFEDQTSAIVAKLLLRKER